MKHAMLDFEALGNGKNAALCQVGAVYFDPDTGACEREFFKNIDARTSQRSGADLDADTVYWWLQQSQEARDSILRPCLDDISSVMHALNCFLDGVDFIWCHVSYDFVILMETMKRLNIKPNFGFRAGFDIRTLTLLAGIKKEDGPPREGVEHDALSDCLHQIKYCTKAWQKIKGIVA